MAAAVVRVFEDHNTLPMSGYVITKHGHLDPSSDDAATLSKNQVTVRTGGHPLPDSDGMLGTQEMVSCLSSLKRTEGLPPLIVYCISGGGSALTCVPASGLTLEDLQHTVSELLSCGASIGEVNAMRKHLTQGVQGGRVPPLVAPSGATIVSLVLSDVVGDSLDVISSGPTVPDTSSFAMCSDIINTYALDSKLPPSVVSCIQEGQAREASEHPQQQKQQFENTRNLFVGSNALALAAGELAAKELGYQTLVLTSRLQGEAKHVARMLAGIARDAAEGGVRVSSPSSADGGDVESNFGVGRPCCILVGGETTVTLKEGHGTGGRNQELALAAALDLAGTDDILLLSAGTDGQDGPTSAAGEGRPNGKMCWSCRFTVFRVLANS
jgi:glycerate 2-kinase